MKKYLIALCTLLCFMPKASADNFPVNNWSREEWNTNWIGAPGVVGNTYNVLLFRKTIVLDEKPSEFVIDISADSRYKFFVNGAQVSMGPCKGDPLNWNYETVDIASALKEGTNVLSATVWNFGADRSAAIMSLGHTALLVHGATQKEACAATNRGWKVKKLSCYSPLSNTTRGYYAAGCTDRVDFRSYPWGWMDESFDDSGWDNPTWISEARPKGYGDYANWMLVPRYLPMMESEAIDMDPSLNGKEIPAGTEVEFLLKCRSLNCGYPRITVSGGKDAVVRVGYAEALYTTDDPANKNKGNRAETEGKFFQGIEDEFVCDGGSHRVFEPLWWRTWRYIRISVKTGDAPLKFESVKANSSLYPFILESSFSCRSDRQLEDMIEVGWRTARLCAHETYMDCPYYEQLQYFGDSRIQALVTMFNTSDMEMVRNHIALGKKSLTSDGLMMSRYPTSVTQFIPPYALLWIGTCHDWWMYRGDEDFLREMLPTQRAVLSFFEGFLSADMSLGDIPYWNFEDWAIGFENGVSPKGKGGRSAYLDLLFTIALTESAQMEESFGSITLADHYKSVASKMKKSAIEHYWNAEKGLFSDNSENSYSQHVNSLAIIAGLLSKEEANSLFKRMVSDPSLYQTTVYFSYYLHEAMRLSGNGDSYVDALGVWREHLALGLTTFAEKPEPSRSDCHAWSASPNINLFRTLLGIDSSAPGFTSVRIEPFLGTIKEVSGSIPHPKGSIRVCLNVDRRGHLNSTIDLPEGVEGVFVWKGVEYPLHGGKQCLKI